MEIEMDLSKVKLLYPNAIKGLMDVLIAELNKQTWSDENKILFLAQCAHESGYFRFIKENLNYSAKGLKTIFPRYFFTRDAMLYAYKPEKIANAVYANRMGNGDEKSGDGWKYRGRGIIQITGKTNYTKCLNSLGVTDPDYLETLEGAVKSAIWFWKANLLYNEKDMVVITKRINGGVNGLDDRKAQYRRIKGIVSA